MFVFWFNTYFLKHGVTLTHPEGGGTIITGKKLFLFVDMAI